MDEELVEAACATEALTQLSAVQRAQRGSAPHLEAPEHLGDEHFKIGPPTTRRRGDARLREITQVYVLASGGVRITRRLCIRLIHGGECCISLIKADTRVLVPSSYTRDRLG